MVRDPTEKVGPAEEKALVKDRKNPGRTPGKGRERVAESIAIADKARAPQTRTRKNPDRDR